MTKRLVILILLAAASGNYSSRAVEESIDKPMMVDASNGWWCKVTAKEAVILRTSDGGKRWTDVSPSDLPGAVKQLFANALDGSLDQLVTLDVLDAQRAWASILPSNDRVIWLEFTADGGRHWTKKVAPIVADSVDLSFLDDRRGFLLACSPPAAGKMSKNVYGTEDGGERWYLLFAPDAVSFYPTGISFRSPLDGWISGTYHGGDDVPLYRTTDGGKSWQLQKFPIPDDYLGGYADTYSPIFIGADRRKGYLPVKLVRHEPAPDHCAWVNYESGDGGETWHLPAAGVSSVPFQ